MVIIGLTGSIGMGKSTAAAMFRRLGVPVQDADATVHQLLGPGGAAVPYIAALYPDVVKDGAVDRGALGARVFGDPVALKQLEGILHPLVARARDHFLKTHARRGDPVVVLDVPLLFETGGDRNCDLTVVVSAPAFIQAQRVMARPGMTAGKLRDILARQMPDLEKRQRADLVVETGLGRRHSLQGLARLVRLAKSIPGRHWPPRPKALKD